MIRSCRQLLRGTLTAILLTLVSHSCLTLADDGFPPQSMIVRPFSDGGVVPDSPQFPGASVGGTADFPVWPQLDAAPFSSSSQFPLHGNGIDEQWSQANWADTSWDWHFLPKGLLYQSYVAGEKEPRFSNAVLSESGGQTQWDSTLGWRLGLVWLRCTRRHSGSRGAPLQRGDQQGVESAGGDRASAKGLRLC